ncbi:cell wall anchor protein [Streptococcus oralis subsp. oralis]|uniref:Cell wall anchor protein n=1 Tax=Streptococcus oralis subsp. oralis TaxID=1891914 RepID=A0A1X1HQP7_STROR|nr:SEC10/PgrA surface exclusion domain-containing protein [Streptococcus oralis]ORO63131.1 cell wall anchor protein [Streptococcus oralis subsp. oralis]
MESNTQGHGTIKKLRTGAVISTLAISALGVANGVSASETEVAVNEPATRVVAKDEVVPKVPSQQDVDKARAESDKANQDVAKQKEVVSTTEANIANVEKTIAGTTKKVEEAKTVTPENVAEAKADAEKRANELATAEKSVADADKSVSATAEKVADQTKVVSNAEKTATDASNKVAEAQNKVDSLSSTTDIRALEKNAYTSTVQVRVSERKVDEAQKKLDDGKKAVADKEQAIKDTQDKISSAEKVLKQAITDLNDAKANQSQKEEAVKAAKSDIDRAKEELSDQGGKYTVNVSQEYVNLLKQYISNPSKELSDQLKALAFKEYEKFGKITFDGGEVYRYDLNYPQASKKDLNTKVDINNLDYETRKELSLFAADLINQLRKQFGTDPVKVTEDAIRIANEVARTSKEEYGHDFDALSKVGEKDNGLLLGELAGFSDDETTTVADLKRRIYDDILSMLFDDSHAKWGHANSLSGVLPANPNVGYMQYTGLGFRSNKRFTSVIHYIKISDNLLSNNSKFDKTKVVTAPSQQEQLTKLQEKVDLAEKSYIGAYSALKEAERGVYLAKTRYGKADDDLYFTRKHLSDIQLNKIDVPALEKALEDAKTQLAEDKKALKTAEEVLELAKTNAIEKAKSLAAAKSALATAKTEKATADKALETAKGELEVLTKAHDVAVLARKSAGQDLARKREASKEATDTYTVLELALTKRDEVLKALDKELTDAKSKLGVLRAELETAKEELARLGGIAEVKARGYENFKQLKAEHDAYLAEQQRLQALKDKADAIRKAGGQPKEVTNADGKVVDIVDAKAQNKPVVATVGTKDDKTYQAPAKATNAKAEPKKQLPNTGTKGSMLGLLGLGLLAGLGLGYTKKNLRK